MFLANKLQRSLPVNKHQNSLPASSNVPCQQAPMFLSVWFKWQWKGDSQRPEKAIHTFFLTMTSNHFKFLKLQSPVSMLLLIVGLLRAIGNLETWKGFCCKRKLSHTKFLKMQPTVSTLLLIVVVIGILECCWNWKLGVKGGVSLERLLLQSEAFGYVIVCDGADCWLRLQFTVSFWKGCVIGGKQVSIMQGEEWNDDDDSTKNSPWQINFSYSTFTIALTVVTAYSPLLITCFFPLTWSYFYLAWPMVPFYLSSYCTFLSVHYSKYWCHSIRLIQISTTIFTLPGHLGSMATSCQAWLPCSTSWPLLVCMLAEDPEEELEIANLSCPGSSPGITALPLKTLSIETLMRILKY